MQEKGKFPSQTQLNPRGGHEVSSSSEPTPRIEKVKEVITLRSGKQIEQPVPTSTEESKEREEAELERIIIKEDAGKKSTPSPFPQALKDKKKTINQVEILEVLSASCLLVCLILFPSVGITIVQHCNTVGIHRSFPQGGV